MHIQKSHVLFLISFSCYSRKNTFLTLLRLNDFTIGLYFLPPVAVYSSTSRNTLNRPFVLTGLSPEFKATFVRGASISNHPRFSLVWFQRRSMHHLYLLQQVLPGSWVPVTEQRTLTELSRLGLWDKRVHGYRHRGCRSWKTLYGWTNWSGREQFSGRAILAQTSWWMRRLNM